MEDGYVIKQRRLIILRELGPSKATMNVLTEKGVPLSINLRECLPLKNLRKEKLSKHLKELTLILKGQKNMKVFREVAPSMEWRLGREYF